MAKFPRLKIAHQTIIKDLARELKKGGDNCEKFRRKADPPGSLSAPLDDIYRKKDSIPLPPSSNKRASNTPGSLHASLLSEPPSNVEAMRLEDEKANEEKEIESMEDGEINEKKEMESVWGELSDVDLRLLASAYVKLRDPCSSFALPQLDVVLEKVFGGYTERQSHKEAKIWLTFFNEVHECVSLGQELSPVRRVLLRCSFIH
jgi:hypothetical protein